jgi:hypothetical protein
VHKDPDAFEEYMKQFEDGEAMQIEIRKERKIRTSGKVWERSNQNGYLFGVVLTIIAKWMGEENLHDVLKAVEIAIGYYKLVNGEKIAFETSKMENGEFQEMCTKIRIWGNREHALNIPEPYEDMDYYNKYI